MGHKNKYKMLLEYHTDIKEWSCSQPEMTGPVSARLHFKAEEIHYLSTCTTYSRHTSITRVSSVPGLAYEALDEGSHSQNNQTNLMMKLNSGLVSDS